MIARLDTKLMRTLRRLGYEGEELNRMYLLISSFPQPLAWLILEQARKSKVPRRPQN